MVAAAVADNTVSVWRYLRNMSQKILDLFNFKLLLHISSVSILIKSDPLFGLFMQGELGVNLNEEFKE